MEKSCITDDDDALDPELHVKTEVRPRSTRLAVAKTEWSRKCLVHCAPPLDAPCAQAGSGMASDVRGRDRAAAAEVKTAQGEVGQSKAAFLGRAAATKISRVRLMLDGWVCRQAAESGGAPMTHPFTFTCQRWGSALLRFCAG